MDERPEENIALLSEQMKIYKQQLDRANQEAYEYKCRCGQQEKRLQDNESLTRRLQEQINYLQSENNDLQRERNRGLYQQGAIDYNVLQLKEENRALKHEVALNKDQIYDLQFCNEKLGQEKELAENQHKQCQTKLYAHVMHNIPVPELPPSYSNQEDLQHQLAKERAKRDALEKEYENFLAIKRQRDELQEQLHNKMAELDHLKQSTGQTAYGKEIKLLKDRAEGLENEVKALEAKNINLREERDRFAKQLRQEKSTKSEFQDQNTMLEEKVRLLEQKLKQRPKPIVHSEREYGELITENKILKEKLKDQRRDFESQCEKLENDKTSLLLQITDLKGQLRDLHSKVVLSPTKPEVKWKTEPQQTIYETDDNGEKNKSRPLFNRSDSMNDGGLSPSNAKPSAARDFKSERMVRVEFNAIKRQMEEQKVELQRLLAENKNLRKSISDIYDASQESLSNPHPSLEDEKMRRYIEKIIAEYLIKNK